MGNKRGLQDGFFLTKGEDLPEQDAVRPYVALHCVDAVEDALWGHPFHRQAGLEEQSPADWDNLAAYTTPCHACSSLTPPPVPSLALILITYVAFHNIV